jgi:hypothetical protein
MPSILSFACHRFFIAMELVAALQKINGATPPLAFATHR